jgi:hypothetical protein
MSVSPMLPLIRAYYSTSCGSSGPPVRAAPGSRCPGSSLHAAAAVQHMHLIMATPKPVACCRGCQCCPESCCPLPIQSPASLGPVSNSACCLLLCPGADEAMLMGYGHMGMAPMYGYPADYGMQGECRALERRACQQWRLYTCPTPCAVPFLVSEWCTPAPLLSPQQLPGSCAFSDVCIFHLL